VIAHSQIVVAQPYQAVSRLPAGLDHAETAVLDWIAAEARRQGRGLLPIWPAAMLATSQARLRRASDGLQETRVANSRGNSTSGAPIKSET
jgi:hypothetical protein